MSLKLCLKMCISFRSHILYLLKNWQGLRRLQLRWLHHPDFRNGNFDTRFVNLFIEDFKNSFSSDLVMDAGLAAIFKLEKLDAINVSYLPSETNNWKNS